MSAIILVWRGKRSSFNDFSHCRRVPRVQRTQNNGSFLLSTDWCANAKELISNALLFAAFEQNNRCGRSSESSSNTHRSWLNNLSARLLVKYTSGHERWLQLKSNRHDLIEREERIITLMIATRPTTSRGYGTISRRAWNTNEFIEVII